MSVRKTSDPVIARMDTVRMPRAGERPARLLIRLFGPLAIQVGAHTLGPGDLGGARPKQVLEILLAARGHHVPTDRLARLLWGVELPHSAAASVQTFVSVLRRHLAPDRQRARQVIVTQAEAYRVASDLVDLDLDRFDQLLERSAREPTHLARRLLEQALELVRGEVLEDEPHATWAQELRSTYQGRVLGAHLEAADAALAELDYAAALAHTEAAAALDRFSERAHRTAMLALYALGRQHDALTTYRQFRARLDEQLGLEPTAQTRQLEARILRQEDLRSLLPRPITRPAADAGGHTVRLLGRTGELDTLERATRQALDGSLALLLLEGEAGLGKTRLLDELATSLVGVRVGRARCSELERHLPYVPLAAALRDALAGVQLTGRRRPALRQVLPELALDQPPATFTEVDALEALADLIAEQAPLVLLIDDLQWADPATIAALSYLQHRGAGIPAAVVVAIRTGQAPPDHPVRRLPSDTHVRLEPLTATELAALAMPDLEASTGGNPRLVTAAIADGGQREPSVALAEAILAQCRAEGAWAYRMLVAAAVLDQPFLPEPLAALLQVNAAELTEELEWLCQRRILRIAGFGFGFRHDLVREVLLASLSPARQRLLRARLHQPIGEPETIWSRPALRSVNGQPDTPPEHLFERRLEDSRDPAFILDPTDDRILAANRAGCAMLGYTREELLATPASRIHPAEMPQLREFLDGVVRDGQGSTIKLTCRTKRGTFLPTEMALLKFDSGGRTYLLGLIQDRSEHRQREPRPCARACGRPPSGSTPATATGASACSNRLSRC